MIIEPITMILLLLTRTGTNLYSPNQNVIFFKFIIH